MIVLALDTTGFSASAAVSQDGVLRAEAYLNVGLTHSETLMPLIDDVLARAGLAPDAVTHVACVAGPGSFTGVRIGVCAAKGLAHALGVPVLRLDALAVLASAHPYAPGLVCPMLDARRDQVYAAAFDGSGALPVPALEARACALADFLDALPKDARCLFTGDGAQKHASRLREAQPGRFLVAPDVFAGVRAGLACRLAESVAHAAMPAAALTPIYLRAPQAEQARNARTKGAPEHANP